jgi:hypothetical protein
MKIAKCAVVVVALLVVGRAPVAHADSFSVTFECLGCGVALTPTAPDVMFPSPTLNISWQGFDFTIVFPSAWQPGDQYSWGSSHTLGMGNISVANLTLGGSVDSNAVVVPNTFGLNSGLVTFTPVGAPEPSSLALLPLGLGALLLMRKRRSRPLAV